MAPLIELGAGFDYDLTAGENIFLEWRPDGAFSRRDGILLRWDCGVFRIDSDFIDVPVKEFFFGNGRQTCICYCNDWYTGYTDL